MEHHILISVAALLWAAVYGSNEIDPDFGGGYDPTTNDYDKVYEIHRVCAEKWGFDYYSIYIPPDNLTAANESIRCAYECEMKARKFIGSDGQLDMDEITRVYYNDWGAHYSNDTKEMTDYVLQQCQKQYNNNEDAEPCSKAYKFQKCIDQEQAAYYERKSILNCIDSWQGKTSTNDLALSYRPNLDRCPPYGGTYCFMEFERFIKNKGVDAFKAVIDESRFLENHPETKKVFYDDIQNCYDVKQSDDRKCTKDIVFFTCMVKTFQEITPLFTSHEE